MSSINPNRCYFVMWPDDQEAMGGHSNSRTPSSSPPAAAAMSNQQGTTLVQINGRSSTSSEEGTPPSSSELGAQPTTMIPVTRLAYQPILLPSSYQDMHQNLNLRDHSPPTTIVSRNGSHQPATQVIFAPQDTAERGNNGGSSSGSSAATFVTRVALPDGKNSESSSSSGNVSILSEQRHHCGKCLLKDNENRHLRKRVQALEEQLCRAIGNKRPKITPGAEPTLIALTSPAAVASSQTTNMHTSHVQQLQNQTVGTVVSTAGYRIIDQNPIAPGSIVTTGAHVSHPPFHVVSLPPPPPPPAKVPDTACTSQMPSQSSPRDISRTVAKVREDSMTVEDDKIELVPGTGVYISAIKLQQMLSSVKTGKQLARKLMSIYWDRGTLARSTLSASSQHYEQLDPSVISAIKTYCVLFDNNSRKSEIHSTMIDKCVQARRPRRSSLRQLDTTGLGFKPDQHNPSSMITLRQSQMGGVPMSLDVHETTPTTSIVQGFQPQQQSISENEEDDDASSTTNISVKDSSPGSGQMMFNVSKESGGENLSSLPRLMPIHHKNFSVHHVSGTGTGPGRTEQQFVNYEREGDDEIESGYPNNTSSSTVVVNVPVDDTDPTFKGQEDIHKVQKTTTPIQPIRLLVGPTSTEHRTMGQSLLYHVPGGTGSIDTTLSRDLVYQANSPKHFHSFSSGGQLPFASEAVSLRDDTPTSLVGREEEDSPCSLVVEDENSKGSPQSIDVVDED